MEYNQALSTQRKTSSGKSFVSNRRQPNLKATLPLAAATLWLLSSNQTVVATDLNTQIATNKLTFSTANFQPKSDRQNSVGLKTGLSTSGFLPSILSFLTSPFKNHLANLSAPEAGEKSASEVNLINFEGRGGNYAPDLTPIFLSQASYGDREFAVASRIKSLIPPEAESASLELETYTVKRGDTIGRIARQHRVSRQELIDLNQIANSNLIFINQQLKIPTNKIAPVKQSEITLTALDLPKNSAVKSQQKSQPKLVDTRLSSNPANFDRSMPISDEERLLRLREDIERMRSQMQQEGNSSPIAISDRQITPKVASEKSADINLATATNAPSSRKDSFNSIDNRAIALNLPPLPSSEEYLPEAFEGYAWPAQGVLTSGYGWRWGRLHKGIDIAAPVGTPIFAAASGEVISAGWNSGGYGNLIELQHLDGSMTLYAHNHRILVNKGQKVRQGEQIAEMGNTGFSTGSHLHFEIHPKGSSAIDPLAFLN